MRRFVLKTPCMRCLPQASAAPTTEAGRSPGAVPMAVAPARHTPPSLAHGTGTLSAWRSTSSRREASRAGSPRRSLPCEATRPKRASRGWCRSERHLWRPTEAGGSAGAVPVAIAEASRQADRDLRAQSSGNVAPRVERFLGWSRDARLELIQASVSSSFEMQLLPVGFCS